MRQNPSYYQDLIKRYLSDDISEAEVQELFDFIYSHPSQADLLLTQNNRLAFEEKLRKNPSLSEDISGRMYSRLIQEIRQIKKPFPVTPIVQHVPFIRRHFRKVGIAASVLLVVGLSGYFLFFNKTEKPTELVTQSHTDVEAPKITRATITLANGKTVSIDSLKQIAQNNVQLFKSADGKIVYAGNAQEVVYNTLTNPRGSKTIDVQLADGSNVWLNAGSSVTYPVAFIGNERKIEITGEAYFEIAHDATKPFFVSKGDIQVKVLGTHFNVNAYDDERNIKVTLLEGSVRVSSGSSEGLLKPGEQAQVTNSVKIVSNVDVVAVMAWKNGLFAFDGYEDINAIMRQLARWYNIDVEYKGEVTTMFGGSVSRSENVSQVLRMLEATGGVSFKVENRKVTVVPVK